MHLNSDHGDKNPELVPAEVLTRVTDLWAQRLTENNATVGNAPARDEPSDDGPTRAEHLKQHLLKRYRGASLEDVYAVDTISTPDGCCAVIRDFRSGIPLRTLPRSEAQMLLRQELTLVRGIGPYRAAQCHQRGWERIDDLIHHPSFGKDARQTLQILNSTPEAVMGHVLGRSISRTLPPVWWTTGFFRPEQFLFMDIETLGLLGTPIILVGVAEWTGEGILLTQYLARSIDEEPAVIQAFLNHAASKAAWITFNGRSFDAPMIQTRSAYYGIPLRWESDPPHYDLLHFARRAWKNRLADCQATTIESGILGIQREDDLPGMFVPEFYDTYRRKHNIGPLTYILDHNRQDLLGMVGIFSQLTREWGQPDAG